MAEESIHVKFNDKKPDCHMSEPVESFADIQVSEDHPEVGPSKIMSSEVRGSEASQPEVDPTSKAYPEALNYEEARDG